MNAGIFISVTNYQFKPGGLMVTIETLGAASKPNRRLTGGSFRFRAVVIVENNRNRAEPDGTAVNRRLGFEVVP